MTYNTLSSLSYDALQVMFVYPAYQTMHFKLCLYIQLILIFSVATCALSSSASMWSRYIRLVYGHTADASNIDPYSLNFVYKRADVQVVSEPSYVYPFSIEQFDWMRNFVIFDYAFSLHRNFTYNPLQDFSWVEVIRQSTRYCHVGNMGWSEGLSNGMWRQGIELPFGCWFWAAAGSGVFVNLKRSLVINKKEFVRHIQAWCESTSDQICNLYDVSDVDKLFCSVAINMNYDSVQLLGEWGDNEILVCYGRCISEAVDGACPPIELRSGLHAEEKCVCSEDYPMLNCNRKTSPREKCTIHPPPLRGRPVLDLVLLKQDQRSGAGSNKKAKSKKASKKANKASEDGAYDSMVDEKRPLQKHSRSKSNNRKRRKNNFKDSL